MTRLRVKSWIVKSSGVQSPRPRGRTRLQMRDMIVNQFCFNPRVLAGGRDVLTGENKERKSCFNPRVLAGGRDRNGKRRLRRMGVSIPASSREDATRVCRICGAPAMPFQSPCPRVMTRPAKPKSKIRRLQFQSLQSRNLAISLQAAGERKVKTMAKICQAETAIRGSLRVHDKRKPLNARRMSMHSFVSTPLQGTLDPME